jgi:hypothetical protein
MRLATWQSRQLVSRNFQNGGFARSRRCFFPTTANCCSDRGARAVQAALMTWLHNLHGVVPKRCPRTSSFPGGGSKPVPPPLYLRLADS